ncbi:major facilitator superfamily domain-containing protein [Irpex rosettiformis]|uniref:Major facilitator superfamily domain-containing protein n=1 Tax=Irpex rosettiformis TaxID=378272 RepID=A0ACB8U861_9APHY|nr:major facilitator superfamily domain-containing protein [Irpex rosettiformis]
MSADSRRVTAPEANVVAADVNEKRSYEGSTSDDQPWDPTIKYDEYGSEEDRKLLRKVDRKLLPVLTALYLLSFLDRSNIGNAKIDGLITDIHVSGPAYNTALAIYFIAYVTFEVPANIILKRFDPQFWLPTLTLLWGIASIFQGFVTNQASLFGIRWLLGATEAGLFPGVVYLFSVYYLRRERHWRVAVFFGGAALAGVLAYAIGKMDGIGGKRGWQWIFILEGLLTVVISVIAYWLVPTWSHKARWLTEDERTRLLARLAADSDAANKEKFEWEYVRQAVTDHLVWGYALLFHGFAFVLYTLSLFMPTIIAELGFATWKAQLMTVPPNALAAAGIGSGAWLAARTGRRAPLIIGSAVIGIIGYIILASTKTAGAQYVGVHFASLGVYTGNALLLSWPSENVSNQTKRAVSVAMQITIGDLGAVTGVLIYRPEWAKNHYRKPHIIAIGYLAFAIVVASTLWWWMAKENRRRDEILASSGGGGENGKLGRADGDEAEGDAVEKIRLGDRHIKWRYQI